MKNRVQNIVSLWRINWSNHFMVFPNLSSSYFFVAFMLKYRFIYIYIYFWRTSDNDMIGSPAASQFITKSFPTLWHSLICIQAVIGLIKQCGGFKNSSSNIRLRDGFKRRPRMRCAAALLIMCCRRSTCGLTCLMSRGQLHYFKSWDRDAAPYEFLSATM